MWCYSQSNSLLLEGEQAMEGLTTRLPFGPRHIGLSDSTTIAILCALIELITESPQNAKLFRSRSGVLLAVKLARSKQHVPKIVFAANKLCSVLSDYKEGYSAQKREGWDISHYTRAAKDTGYSLEFEPKSISKDFRTSVHIKSNKKRKEKDYSKSATSLEDRAGIELPPSPVPSNATTNLGTERQSSPALNFEPNYDMVNSTHQKPTSQSVPILGTMGTYAVIPEDPIPSKDQQGSGDVGHFDPNAVYAQVDKNKKRGTRRSSGKDDLPPTQHAPYPVDETAGGDSWV